LRADDVWLSGRSRSSRTAGVESDSSVNVNAGFGWRGSAFDRRVDVLSLLRKRRRRHHNFYARANRQHSKNIGGIVTALLATGTPLTLTSSAAAGTYLEALSSLPLDCDAEALPVLRARICTMRRRIEGRRLFAEETFGGNGRCGISIGLPEGQ
jgi:hypothetical protein